MEKKQRKGGKPTSPAKFGKSLKKAKPNKPLRGVKGVKADKEYVKGRKTKPEADFPKSANFDMEGEVKPLKADKPAFKSGDKPFKAGDKPFKSGDKPFKALKNKKSSGNNKFVAGKSTKKSNGVYIGIGSNMGDRRQNIANAIEMIQGNIGKVTRRSGLYETTPWGKTDQTPFYNQIIIVNTMKKPRELLQSLQFVERKLGRERKEKYGPRTIDLDILLYGKKTINDAGLAIPHPEIGNRMFVLVPLMEIAPTFVHPVTGQNIDELFMDCRDDGTVVLLDS